MIDRNLFWEMVRDGRRFTGLDNPNAVELDTAEVARTYLKCLMEPLDLHGVIEMAEAECPRPNPRPVLRHLAQQHPEIGWLVFLPARERAWYRRPPILARLMAEYPAVKDEGWQTLLA